MEDFLRTLSSGNNMLFIILGVFAVYFIFFRIIPFFRRIRRAMGSFEMNSKANLTPEQYRKLVVGAIYSEQQSAYINSLETGLEMSKITTIANEWWGVNNTEEALDTLDYLYKKGFSYYFPFVYRAFRVNDEEEQKNILVNGLVPDKELTPEEEEVVQEDLNKAYSQLVHLKETYSELVEDKIIETQEDIERYGVIGWDCGRLTFLARICYDAGYITEEQAWYFVEKSYELSKQNCNSWDDLAKSYVIGRALWGGKESHNSGIASIAESLLSDPKSPWIQMKW